MDRDIDVCPFGERTMDERDEGTRQRGGRLHVERDRSIVGSGRVHAGPLVRPGPEARAEARVNGR